MPTEDKDASSLARTAINALSAHIAVLDHRGVILETNRAWKAYAGENDLAPESPGEINYLEVCDRSAASGDADAARVAEGIRAVLADRLAEFRLDYPCHSPRGRQWFYLRVLKIPGAEPARLVVSHEDITDLKLAEEKLLLREQALEAQRRELEEANIALRVVARQNEKDRAELEERILSNVASLVLPHLEKLRNARLRPREKTSLEMAEAHLRDILSPLIQKLAAAHIFLTPQEMEVAALVREGKTSKEIADHLGVSDATVHFHRKNLRRKLGLKSRAANLRTYLLSLA